MDSKTGAGSLYCIASVNDKRQLAFLIVFAHEGVRLDENAPECFLNADTETGVTVYVNFATSKDEKSFVYALPSEPNKKAYRLLADRKLEGEEEVFFVDLRKSPVEILAVETSVPAEFLDKDLNDLGVSDLIDRFSADVYTKVSSNELATRPIEVSDQGDDGVAKRVVSEWKKSIDSLFEELSSELDE